MYIWIPFLFYFASRTRKGYMLALSTKPMYYYFNYQRLPQSLLKSFHFFISSPGPSSAPAVGNS